MTVQQPPQAFSYLGKALADEFFSLKVNIPKKHNSYPQHEAIGRYLHALMFF